MEHKIDMFIDELKDKELYDLKPDNYIKQTIKIYPIRVSFDLSEYLFTSINPKLIIKDIIIPFNIENLECINIIYCNYPNTCSAKINMEFVIYANLIKYLNRKNKYISLKYFFPYYDKLYKNITFSENIYCFFFKFKSNIHSINNNFDNFIEVVTINRYKYSLDYYYHIYQCIEILYFNTLSNKIMFRMQDRTYLFLIISGIDIIEYININGKNEDELTIKKLDTCTIICYSKYNISFKDSIKYKLEIIEKFKITDNTLKIDIKVKTMCHAYVYLF